MTALYLYERLTRMGYRVAYDFETLLNGRWDDAILRTIEKCRDVVVVLNPGALDRCVAWEQKRSEWERAHDGDTFPERDDTNDWMRREVACAIANGKNILPVLLRDFSFPPADTLPEDIRVLPFQNGVGASPEHRHDTLARLVKRLTAKPVWYRRPAVWIAGLAIAAALAAAFAATTLAIGAPSLFTHDTAAPKTFPSTRAEEQTVNEVLHVVGNLATAYQCAAKARMEFVDGAIASLGSSSGAESDTRLLRKRLNDALDILDKTRPSEEAIAKLADTPLDMAVYRALVESSRMEIEEDLKTLPKTIPFYLRQDNSMSDKDKKACLQKNRVWMELQSRFFALGIIELLQPVSPNVLKEFKRQATTYTAIPRLATTWPSDKDSLDIEQEAVMQQLQAITLELATVVGNQNTDYSAERRKLEETLRKAGATSEEIADILGKIEANAAQKTEETWNGKTSD